MLTFPVLLSFLSFSFFGSFFLFTEEKKGTQSPYSFSFFPRWI